MQENADVLFPCNKCDALCCRNYTQALTAHDVKRLYEKLGNFSFAGFSSAERYDEKRAPHLLLNGKKYILHLARDENENCVLLGKEGRCTVYPARPMRCRIYPFEIVDGKTEMKADARCPAGWFPDDSGKLKTDAEQHEMELSHYGRICEDWNDKEGANAEGFYSFLAFLLKKLE